MEKVKFDITKQVAVVRAKTGRSLDEQALLQSFRDVEYHRPLRWLELTLVGTPGQYEGKPIFKVGKTNQMFLVCSREGEGKSVVLDRYLEALSADKQVVQITGRLAGWKLEPGKKEQNKKKEDGLPVLFIMNFDTEHEGG